jgi:hypothetical protein
MYLDPAITSTANIVVAAGPDFLNFRTDVFPSGSFGTVSGYTTVDAGGKQLFLSPGDADTSALTITSEQLGTLLVLPRPDVSQSRFALLWDGRSFEAIGVEGSSEVRFINTITRGSADTTDVSVDVNQLPDSTVVVSGLAFRSTSNFILVPAGSTVSYYLTRAGTSEVLTGSVTVTGSSNTIHTVVGYGTADAAMIDDFTTE